MIIRKWFLAAGIAAFMGASAPVFAGSFDSLNINIGVGGSKGGSAVSVPPKHMPPAGKCRIWYKNRKPGNQPPPGNCKKLKNKVPAGAVLIRG